jgi:hypothetical protein
MTNQAVSHTVALLSPEFLESQYSSDWVSVNRRGELFGCHYKQVLGACGYWYAIEVEFMFNQFKNRVSHLKQRDTISLIRRKYT